MTREFSKIDGTKWPWNRRGTGHSGQVLGSQQLKFREHTGAIASDSDVEACKELH